MYSYGPPHIAERKQDDQLEHTYSSSVRIRNLGLKTCQKRWMIGRSGERGSGISMLEARHCYDDDDDDDIYIWWYFWNIVFTDVYIYTSIHIQSYHYHFHIYFFKMFLSKQMTNFPCRQVASLCNGQSALERFGLTHFSFLFIYFQNSLVYLSLFISINFAQWMCVSLYLSKPAVPVYWTVLEYGMHTHTHTHI